MSNKSEIDIDLPADLTPGTKLWITAMWVGARMTQSPAAEPISTYVAGGIRLAA